MTWRGGFSGLGFTRDEFKKWLANSPKPSWVQFMVSHNTAAPYIKPPVKPSTRIQNLGAYYKNLGWSTGPNIIVILDKVYIGTPWGYPGTNSPGFNGKGLGVEVEGDYRTGHHDPKTGDGLVAWNTAAWVFAETLAWLGLPVDGTHLKLHKEDPKTTHDCPGNLVTKDWLLGKVKAAAGQPITPDIGVGPVAKPFANQLYDVLEIQKLLKDKGFDPGPLDGLMGPKTDSAIKALQTSLQIGATGVLGPWAYGRLKTMPNAASEAPVAPEQIVNDTYRPISELHVSDFGLSWFKRFEGLMLTAYNDRGTLAIGYGHNASSKRPPIPTGTMKITAEEAEAILKADLVEIEAEVRKVLGPVMLKQCQFDALLLDCFQRGQTQFTKTPAVEAIKSGGDASAAMHAQSDSTKDLGLKRRRLVEAQIFDGDKPTKW